MDNWKNLLIKLGGKQYTTKKNKVPIILFRTNKTTYSICYMKRKNVYRVFSNFGETEQEKQDFYSVSDLVVFLIGKEINYNKKQIIEFDNVKGVPIREFFVDPTWDALEPRWWHKLIFWKKWRYPKYILTREWKKLD